MVKVKKFQIPSSDGQSRLYGNMWIPEEEPKAALQIVHGMKEYMKRYDEFARYLAERGVLVIGHDQLGHGRTTRAEERGNFATQNGAAFLMRDIRHVSRVFHKRFPGIPYFMLGHSMGSFLLRRYVTLYDDMDGVILMGTGSHSLPVMLAGNAVASVLGLIRGKNYRSPVLYKLVTGKYNGFFRPVRTAHDWLSTDRKKAAAFSKDPYSDFYFTCGAYEDFFQIVLDLNFRREFERIPRDLPVLLVSGSKDPVGGFGKGVKKVYRTFRGLGMKNLRMKLYPGMRHEILHELGRSQVYGDLASWLKENGV